MAGFDRFQKAIVASAVQHFKPLLEEHKSELSQVIKNHLLDLDGPKHLKRKSNARDQYFWRLFHGFQEISKSLEMLDDIHFYIRRYPFAGTRITPERYLQFHVEAHYEEIYVLRERIVSLVTLLKRQFRRDPTFGDVEARCDALVRSIEGSLRGVVALRGQHIHRFRFTDDGIDRLGSVSLLAQSSDEEFTSLMKAYYREQRRDVKRTWAARTKGNLAEIRRLLDFLFEALFPIAFDRNGELRTPPGVRA